MAFKPSKNLDFSKPELWATWRQHFMRYRTASKLLKEDFEVQVSSLIYSMGADAEKDCNTFTIHTGEHDVADTTFDDAIAMFDTHFNPKVNIIHERAVFHQRNQLPGENIETYVRSLYDLAEHASFDDKDNAIRDRLVVGLRDREL